VKSDSCKKDEPIVIKEEINNVQNESYLKETSISIYELNSPMGQTGNYLIAD
jgi:hypothetical protein